MLFRSDLSRRRQHRDRNRGCRAAALFVPFPFAVDDHQTTNARFLVDQGGGWLLPQADLTAQGLADWLQKMDRGELLACAQRAHQQRKTNATREVVVACEELAA